MLGLPSNVAAITLGCIFSVLCNDFRIPGPISIPTPPIAALTEFFTWQMPREAVTWYFISSL